MSAKKQEESTGNLLKELCGADAELHAFLSRSLYESPLAAVSKQDLELLIAEAEKSGEYGPALDKVVFENSQNLGEQDRYAGILQDLATKAIAATESEIDGMDKTAPSVRIDALSKRIEAWRFMIERAEDILDVAAKFYAERLLEWEQGKGKKEREQQRRRAENEEQGIKKREKRERSARKRARRKMGWAERRDARKQERRERVAAEERSAERAEERKQAARDEVMIEESERAERQVREAARDKKTGEETDVVI